MESRRGAIVEMMSEKELEKILKAVANKRRLLILRFLKKNKEATVGQIAGAIKLSFKSTSRHLAILHSADIVDREQRSTEAHYSITPNLFPLIKQLISIV